ncbi:hypothetical protein R1sor_011820 [Riccia sorocarpa]|uniref:Uncharacterized protein n=1 Tax=Riccia sorocarpa TaxID=122646 RepID=A0ABD3I860_9MARC
MSTSDPDPYSSNISLPDSPVDDPTSSKTRAVDYITKALELMDSGSMTQNRRMEIKSILLLAQNLITKETSMALSSTSAGILGQRPLPKATEKLHISFTEGSYPKDLSHDQLKKQINSAIAESGSPTLRVQAIQKYKNSLGIIVESADTQQALLSSGNSWGPKAFESFSTVAPPKIRHQILVHDIPVDLSLEDIESGLTEDNVYLQLSEKPRWLLKDLSTKKRFSS